MRAVLNTELLSPGAADNYRKYFNIRGNDTNDPLGADARKRLKLLNRPGNEKHAERPRRRDSANDFSRAKPSAGSEPGSGAAITVAALGSANLIVRLPPSLERNPPLGSGSPEDPPDREHQKVQRWRRPDRLQGE